MKCDNIFVSSSTGDVRIGDLGLSTFMKNSHNKTILGTPQYMAPELYEERYGPSVDIYSFGLCVLEMCTHTTPYAECKTPLEIYHKVISGKKPSALERIVDKEIKEFIEICLSPVDQRPHAEELLNHKFLVIEESDEKVHEPVHIKDEEEVSPVNSKKENDIDQDTPTIMEVSSQKIDPNEDIKIELKIGFRDPVIKKVIPVRLDFFYHTNTDTPESLSEEIINLFIVDPSYTYLLAQVIREKIVEHLNEKANKKDQSDLPEFDYKRSLLRKLTDYSEEIKINGNEMNNYGSLNKGNMSCTSKNMSPYAKVPGFVPPPQLVRNGNSVQGNV